MKVLEKQGGVPMSNEETILRELKQCYYSEGEELTYKKDKFLMEMLVARIAGLFDEKDPIFWAGHEKSINIWAATPVKSPITSRLWELFGPSDAKFIFLTAEKAVYINVVRLLEEENRLCYEVKEIHSILCGYYWTKKEDEVNRRAVRIVTEEHSEFHPSVTISNTSYNELVDKINSGSMSPIKEKVIILEDTDSIKKYHAASIRRKSSQTEGNQIYFV